MKSAYKLYLIIFVAVASASNLFAQNAQAPVEMADKMREDGKIWIVVAIITVIFLGIAANMLRIDAKISKIEKELNIK